MSLKRLIALAAASVLAVLALSGPAAAYEGKTQSDDTWAKAQCVFDGKAGTGIQQVQAVFADEKQGGGWDATQQLMDTDAGTFEFRGQATCDGVDNASEADQKGSPQTVLPAVFDMHAKGIFDNLICGTGDAKGNSVVTGVATTHYLEKDSGVSVIEEIDVEIHAQFAIQFVAGVGDMSIVVQQSSPDGQGSHSHVGDNAVDEGKGRGVIWLIPDQWQGVGGAGSEPCIGTPGDQQVGSVDGFIVRGAFETSLAGEGAQFTQTELDSDA